MIILRLRRIDVQRRLMHAFIIIDIYAVIASIVGFALTRNHAVQTKVLVELLDKSSSILIASYKSSGVTCFQMYCGASFTYIYRADVY